MVGISRNLWTQSLCLFCFRVTNKLEDEKSLNSEDFLFCFALNIPISWARELAQRVRVICSCLRVDSKERFIRTEKQDLLLGGSVFWCSSLRCVNSLPDKAAAVCQYSTEKQQAVCLSSQLGMILPSWPQDTWQGLETSLLVVPTIVGWEWKLLESGGWRPGVLLNILPHTGQPLYRIIEPKLSTMLRLQMLALASRFSAHQNHKSLWKYSFLIW